MDFFSRLEAAFPNPIYRAVVISLFILIVALALLLLVPYFSSKGSRFKSLREQRPNLVLGIVIIALLLVMAVAAPNRWQWLIALLPTLMVGYQIFYLWLHHPREI